MPIQHEVQNLVRVNKDVQIGCIFSKVSFCHLVSFIDTAVVSSQLLLGAMQLECGSV